MNAAPTPFYFGPAGAGLFGWLHAAPAESRAAFGLVICNPFGFEEVCAHRSLAHLAERAAAAGIPTLRFDAAGCGNAEGDEFEPDRLGAWLGSVHAAIEALEANAGVARVCVLGMRLGASIAALAAAQRDDVDALIAIAPVVRGREWLRELRMLDGGGTGRPGEPLESAGFVLTAEMVGALNALDLRAMPKPPAPRVLVVERDDLPAPRHWQEALERLGVETRTEAWPGYAAIMSNPQDARLPHAIVDGVVEALVAWHAAAPGTSADRVAATRADDPPARARERITRSGSLPAVRERIVGIAVDGTALFGIATAPAADAAPRTGILMLNSGSVHHIGPNRLWVTLARRWAARGATVLRIDLSGIGDSPAHPGAPENRVYSPEAARDIAAAVAWLRREGVETVQLLGLCSGAFHALNAAVAGEAIGAALMINPLTFSWDDCTRLGSSLNEHEVLELSAYYRRQAFSADTWKRLVRGELDLKVIGGVLARRLHESTRALWAIGRRGLGSEPPGGLGAVLASAAQRRIRLHFVFGEGASGYALMRHQAGGTVDALRAHSQLSLDLVPDSDHTFTRLAARERLIAVLDALVFAPADPPRAALPRQALALAGLRANANASTAATPTAASTSSISR